MNQNNGMNQTGYVNPGAYMNQNQQINKPGGKGLAIASVALGVTGLLLVCLMIGIFPAVAGLIVGIVSLVQNRDGKGLAIAGVILSTISIIMVILIVSKLKLSVTDIKSDADQQKNVISESVEPETPIHSEVDQSAIEPEQTEEISDKTTTAVYGAGVYIVGKDIPAGEYVIETGWTDRQSRVHLYDSWEQYQEGYEMREFAYFYNRIYVTVSDGDCIDVEVGIVQAESEVAPHTAEGAIQAGTYKVGKDLRAGSYTVSPLTADGYMEISSDSTLDWGSMITAKGIETVTEIYLNDGEYITIGNAEMTINN